MTIPPRCVIVVAPAPAFGTTHSSPNAFVESTVCRSSSSTSIPSSRSSKTIPSAIDEVGGCRPPWPISTGAGNGLPCERKVVDGEVSSVSGRSPADANSGTLPETFSASPTATVGVVEPVKTKIPSEVAGSPSPAGSCR